MLKVATLGVAGLIVGLLAGCSASPNSVSLTAYAGVTGNWKFSSTAPAAARLPALAGNLTVNGAEVSGTLHPLASSVSTILCAPSGTGVAVSGTIDAQNRITLTGPGFSGGVLTLSGTLSADQKNLTGATYNVAGGACAFPSASSDVTPLIEPRSSTPAIAQQFMPINGSYAGKFVDTGGLIIVVTGTLTQTTQPDGNGVFHLAGRAEFANNPCLTSPVLTDSTVTGNTLTATYNDVQSGNSVTATGTFNTDATILNITDWKITGTCGDDNGAGILTRQ